MSARLLLLVLLLVLLGAGCEAEGDGAAVVELTRAADGAQAPAALPVDDTARRLHAAVDTLAARAQAMDDALRPLPLLKPRDTAPFRRYRNADQLVRARALGISPDAVARGLDALVQQGRLVRLEDSTAYWVVRELDHSRPYVTPDAKALLEALGRRFQARLAEMGLPPLRFEVSSALRTAATQAALRTENDNATRGTSTHEYGTTVDVAYSGYAAAQASALALPTDTPPWLADHLRRLEALTQERVAARRSRELQAVMGQVLRAMQDEGLVMVTLETQQPVYHMTVNRRS